MPPAVSPLLILSVLLAFASGMTLAFVASARGQQGRFGAQLGILLGAPLSIPVGVFGGIILWSGLEEASPISEVMAMTVGPAIGSFLGTLLVTLITREVASWIESRLQR